MPSKPMSQTHLNSDNGKVNYAPRDKPIFKKGHKGRGKYLYQPQFPYYRHPFGFQPTWNFFRFRKPPFRMRPERGSARPPSPFSGTEEYTMKKIQEASDMIKKQLMMPPDADDAPAPAPVDESQQAVAEKKNDKCEKVAVKSKKAVHYDVEEIHHKIITHITNLNHGKKMNLICATSSGYDVAIQQIQRQKRLELSKVLRDMCSKQTVESSDVINSIIPDIGIKIEDLPLEVIQELSSTLDLNFQDAYLQEGDGTVRVKTEIYESDSNSFTSSYPSLTDIKIENNSYDDISDLSDYPSEPLESTNNDDKTTDESTATHSNKTNSESSQTELVNYNSNSTQTDHPITSQFHPKNKAENLEDAIKSMFEIDKEIARLTKLRQSIFLKLRNVNVKNSIRRKKAKTVPTITDVTPKKPENEALYKTELDFGNITEKMLALMVIEDTLVAGSESGKIFYLDLKDGSVLSTVHTGDSPITSISTYKKKKPHLFVSSFEFSIREYEFGSRSLIRMIHIGESVQCMEISWDFLFVGTIKGTLMRYSLTKNKVEFEDQISDDRILVLKATQEGARRVLLVGTRNRPVCVRDAMSGLHMRTMNHVVAPTVYSLLLENSLVYCGTTFHDILVYAFHDGNLIRKYQASHSKGVGCMRIVENLLFASCHNGKIYVYNTKTHQYVGHVEGPGGVILSMEVFKNIIIVGTMSFNFKSLLIPEHILDSNRSD